MQRPPTARPAAAETFPPVPVPADAPAGSGGAAAEDAPARVWQRDFGPYGQSVRLVRRQVERAMARWGLGAEETDTVALVCTELATHAVACAPEATIAVQVTLTGRTCLIEATGGAPTSVEGAASTTRGEWGQGSLQLVAALAEESGHREGPGDGRTVWARVKLP